MLVEGEEKAGSLSFVMHGLGGDKTQPHIQVMAEVFLENSFSVVRFDTTNTFGESEGDYEDATVTNYYEDLEDVIEWSHTQGWYREPFWLVGHSLGGICTALYAEKSPEKVAGLAPISSTISGALSKQAGKHKEKMAEWERTGWREYESETVPGRIKRLKWSHMIDRLKYDLLPEAGKLTMPVLLIVGEDDKSTPPEHQRILLDALPGAPHTFRDEKHLREVKQIFDSWIKKFSQLKLKNATGRGACGKLRRERLQG